MYYVVLLVLMLTITASALKLIPVYKSIASKLYIIICILSLGAAIFKLVIRRDMFIDLLCVESSYIFNFLAAESFCIAAAAAVSFILKRK